MSREQFASETSWEEGITKATGEKADNALFFGETDGATLVREIDRERAKQ
jgi:hypothetical protein